jgi:two-component system, chemotaxis family, chemotaxis protein CheY
MPGQSGLDLLIAIRGSGSKVPVVLITTEGEKTQVLSAIRAGVSDYVVKPFEADALRQKLDKFLTAAV